MSVFEDIKRGLEQAITHEQKGNNNMIEIIGEHMMPVFEHLHIFPKNTYSGTIGYWKNFEVWELSNDEFYTLTTAFDGIDGDRRWSRMAPSNAWWRSAEGSNQGVVNEEFFINETSLMAWRSCGKIAELQEIWDELSEEDKDEYKDFTDYCDFWLPKYYNNILEYIHEELHASTEGNVCALVTDLAKQNNMTMADVFRIYG